MDARLNLVETFDEVKQMLAWLEGYRGRWLGVDTETEGLDWWRHDVRTVQIGGADAGWCIEFARWRGVIEHALAQWQGDVVLHNAKFDLLMLAHRGIHLNRARVYDSMVAVHVLEPNKPKGLKPAAERHVHKDALVGQQALWDAMGARTGWTWENIPINLPAYWQYAALDPVLTVRLMEKVWPLLTDQDRAVYELDMGASLVLMDMELRGMKVDRPYVLERIDTLGRYVHDLRTDAWNAFGGVDLGKDAQLVSYLQGEGVTFVTHKEKGNVKLDNAVLEAMQHPIAPWVLAYRRASKRVSTYFQPWILNSDDRSMLHASFNVQGARTSRMSSERPNLQNVPRSREVRSGLVPAEEHHVLVLADYDQIELRIMAHVANEEAMIRAIHEGVDLHTNTARLVFGTESPTKEQRRIAKHANFAKIYGAGTAKFAATAGIGYDEAAAFVQAYEAEFPGVVQVMNTISGSRVGGAFEMRTAYAGRRQVATEGYKLVNYVVQGTAADVFKRKLIEVDAAGLGDYLRVPIHDEMAFSVPRNEAEEFARELPSVMEDLDSFKVPLSVGVEIVSSWGDKYEEGT